MRDSQPFKDRVLTTELTPEFIRHNTDYPQARAEDVLEEITRRLERSYAVVAEVEEKDDHFYGTEPGYVVRVIPTKEANRDAIGRGIESVHYWVAEGLNDE